MATARYTLENGGTYLSTEHSSPSKADWTRSCSPRWLGGVLPRKMRVREIASGINRITMSARSLRIRRSRSTKKGSPVTIPLCINHAMNRKLMRYVDKNLQSSDSIAGPSTSTNFSCRSRKYDRDDMMELRVLAYAQNAS